MRKLLMREKLPEVGVGGCVLPQERRHGYGSNDGACTWASQDLLGRTPSYVGSERAAGARPLW